jgi:hypothetical protein
MKIDAVIPFHSKDSNTINWCVQGIKNHLNVARILVVCNQESRSLVENTGAIFFDENKVIEGLTAESYPHKRWGWYYQQILKLGMADWVETDHYLIVDADTVFLRNVPLISHSGKPLYATGKEFHKPYLDVFERLLGFRAKREFSFTVHHMIYNAHIVREMRERFPEKPWYLKIIKYVEPQAPWFSGAQFSEYETYGHYIKALHPNEANIRPLRWTNIGGMLPTETILRKLARYFDFCSFHAYSRESREGWIHRVKDRVALEILFLTNSIFYSGS